MFVLSLRRDLVVKSKFVAYENPASRSSRSGALNKGGLKNLEF